MATLYDNVPKSRRGFAQGLFSIISAAGNLAPYLVGAFAGGSLGSYSLGTALLWLVSGAYLVSSICFALTALSDDKKILKQWKESVPK